MTSTAETRRWSWKGKVLALLPVSLAALLLAAFYWGLNNKDDRLPSPLIGRSVPDFVLPPIEGRADGLTSAVLKGQVSLVNVWASWCVPCRVEMPLLGELAATGAVPIYGINYKDRPEAALAFLAELGDPYVAIGADVNGRISIDWGVYGLPETFVVGADGRIALKHVGPVTRPDLEKTILPLVARLRAEATEGRR